MLLSLAPGRRDPLSRAQNILRAPGVAPRAAHLCSPPMSGPLGTYAAFVVCLGAATAGRTGDPGGVRAPALVATGAGRRPRGALPARLVDGAAAGATARRRSSAIAWSPPGSALYVLPRVEGAGAGRCATGGAAGAGRGRRSPRCRSSSSSASGSSAPGSTPTCRSTCSRPTGWPSGGSERLIDAGYPLGPHSIVVAAVDARAEHGAGLRRAARSRSPSPPASSGSGLLRASGAVAADRRGAAASGSPTCSPPTYVQGAFKETMEALFADRVRDRRSASSPRTGRSSRRAGPRALRGAAARGARRRQPSTPTASPGSSGLAGALGGLGGRRARARGAGRRRRPRHGCRRGRRRRRRWSRSRRSPSSARPGARADASTSRASRPSIRPASGLGNLFNRLSPLEALGIWPSGDFRVEPGDGAVPGVRLLPRRALAAAALVFGLRWCAGASASARVPAALAAARCCSGSTRCVAGTPYQEAKALVLVAPLAMLIACGRCSSGRRRRRGAADRGAGDRLRVPGRAGGEAAPRGGAAVVPPRRRGLERASRSSTGRSGRAATRPRSPSCDGAAAGLDRGRRAPDELLADQHGGRLDRLGAARQPDLRRRRSGPSRRSARGRSATLTVGLDDDGAVVPYGRRSAPRRRRGPGPVPADPGRRPRRSERGRLTGTVLAPARASLSLSCPRTAPSGYAFVSRSGVELLRLRRDLLRAASDLTFFTQPS